MTILFPDPKEAIEQENPGLLPCRTAEIVLHPKISGGGTDITQLIVKCKRPCILTAAMVLADVYLP